MIQHDQFNYVFVSKQRAYIHLISKIIVKQDHPVTVADWQSSEVRLIFSVISGNLDHSYYYARIQGVWSDVLVARFLTLYF